MARSTVSLYVAPESTFGTDPDATGAAYLAAQTMGRPLFTDDQGVVPSKYATGRNRETTYLLGADGASLSTEHPLVSLSVVYGDGGSLATADWLDAILTAAFGASSSVIGEGLNTGGSTTTLVLDTDALDVQQLACVNFSNRSEWRYVTADAGGGTYTIAPALSASYDATRDALGYRYWTFTDTSGATCTVYTEIGGTGYLLTGGRPGLKLSMVAGAEHIKLSASWKFDAKTQESQPASLPAVSAFSNTPMRGVLSPVYFNGTAYPTKSVEIDWGHTPTVIGSTAATNGRANIENLTSNPKITIEPAFSTTLESAFRAGTEGPLLVQLGSGALAGGRGNTCAFYAPSAQVIACQPSDDNNYLRSKVTLQVTDRGIRTGTTAYPFWMFARA